MESNAKMYRVLRSVALVGMAVALSNAAGAQYVTLQGALQGSNGTPLPNAVIDFTPTQNFYVPGTNTTVPVDNIYGNGAPTNPCLISGQLYTNTATSPPAVSECIFGTGIQIVEASGVASLNTLTGALSLTSSDSSVTITPSGSTINLQATGGASGVQYNPSTTTYYIVGDSIAGVGSSCIETSLPSDTATITAGTISGTTATFTATNTYSSGCVVTLSGFTGSYTALNGQIVTISATGLSGSQFEATVAGVSAGATGAGQAQATYNLTGQLSREPYIHGHGTVVNDATSSQTIAQMLTAYPTTAHLSSPAVTGKPGFLIIFTGTQDLYNGTSLSTMESGMQAYWAAARADNWTGIIQTTTVGYSASGMGAAPESQWAAYNSWLMAQGPTNANVTAGEYWDRIVPMDKWMPNAFDANYFQQSGATYHLTDMGAKVAADALNLAFSAQGSNQGSYPYCLSVFSCPNLTESNTFTSGPEIIGGAGPASGWEYDVTGGHTIGLSGYLSNLVYLYVDGQPDLELIPGSGLGVQIPSTGVYGFLSGTWVAGSLDTALSRDSAGVIDVGTGAQGNTGGSMKMTNLTVLGTCTGCGSGSTGLSGMTAGQVPIAATATTVTSSHALAGSGAGITTGPITSTNLDCAEFSGTGGQIADSGAPCGSTGISNATFTVGTTAITANTCTSASTVAMTGVAPTSVFMISPASDVSAVAGWGSTGGLVIDAWPTANTLNYKVCNQTAASITPGASVTFNVGAR